MTKIFLSLNSVDLPEFFEDHMQEWMTHFHNLLIFDSTLEEIVGDQDEEKAGLLHKVNHTLSSHIILIPVIMTSGWWRGIVTLYIDTSR